VKITDAKVLVCCPGRNFLTLKTYTDEGYTALGNWKLDGTIFNWQSRSGKGIRF
jgi:mannonate dehydratase